MKTPPATIYLTEQQLRKLKLLAIDKKSNVSKLVREAVEEYLKKEENERNS